MSCQQKFMFCSAVHKSSSRMVQAWCGRLRGKAAIALALCVSVCVRVCGTVQDVLIGRIYTLLISGHAQAVGQLLWPHPVSSNKNVLSALLILLSHPVIYVSIVRPFSPVFQPLSLFSSRAFKICQLSILKWGFLETFPLCVLNRTTNFVLFCLQLTSHGNKWMCHESIILTV